MAASSRAGPAGDGADGLETDDDGVALLRFDETGRPAGYRRR